MSFVSYCLDESRTSKDPVFEESIIRDTAGTLYLGELYLSFSTNTSLTVHYSWCRHCKLLKAFLGPESYSDTTHIRQWR